MYPRTLILNPSGSGAFTFATLPVAAQMSGEVAGVQAYTSDEGMCYWDGGAWHPSGASGEGLVANTYAAARLLSGVATGDRLQVLGRTTQSDGGQGLFTWVAGGSTSINDGTQLSAPGGIWQRTKDQVTTPLMFGAVGNGVADDNVALTAAAATGYCYLPAGYTFKTSVTINVPANGVFVGAGMGSSIIQGVAVVGPVIQVGLPTNSGTWHPNVTVGNFQISGTATTALAASTYCSDIYDIWANGTFSFNAFALDVTFGSTLTNLTTTGSTIGSTLTFSGSVGGATSGTISSGTNPGNGVYMMVFANAEVRAVTIAGTAASWTTALKAGSVTTAAYGAGFFLGGAFNANACNTLYTGGGPAMPFNFILDDTNGHGNSAGSILNGITAQNGQIGVFFGLNHASQTFNALYTENCVTPIVYGARAGLRGPTSITINGPTLAGPQSGHTKYANRYAWIDAQYGVGLKVVSPIFLIDDGTAFNAYPLTFTGGTVVTAPVAYAFANAAGVIKGVALLYPGHYTAGNPPTACSYAGGNPGSGATFSLTTTATTPAGQTGVATITVTAGGSGYTASTGMVPVLINQIGSVSIDNPILQWGLSQSTNGISPMLAYNSVNSVADQSFGLTIIGDNGYFNAEGPVHLLGASCYKAPEYVYREWVQYTKTDGTVGAYSVPLVTFP